MPREISMKVFGIRIKEWRNKTGWTTKKVDEHFGYKHTAGHWIRKDNK